MRVNFDKLDKSFEASISSVIPSYSSSLTVPDDFFQTLLRFSLERSYLENLTKATTFPKAGSIKQSIGWTRINRLPVHPGKLDEYNLLPRWQNVLSTMHLWNHRLIFTLIRNEGKTSLYLGISDKEGILDYKSSANRITQAVTVQMPGTELKLLGQDEAVGEIVAPLTELGVCGAVTGIPSPKKVGNYGLLQTLDQLAFGIRDYTGYENNYAIVVVADPVEDSRIADLIGTMLNLQSEIHDKIQVSVQESTTQGFTDSTNVNIGVLAAQVLCMASGLPDISSILGSNTGISKTKTRSFNKSKSVSKQYLNRVAQYCEQTLEKHVKRLEQGRNLGFWNTGIYVLADLEDTAETVMGIMRSIYSGEDTYIEPIRAVYFNKEARADEYVKKFMHLPFPYDMDKAKAFQRLADRSEGWHPFGPMFESVTTPLNTEELSIATSLPRRDVPGLRFVRNAVRFATNPPAVDDCEDSLTIGSVMDTGVQLDMRYSFDINSLVKHGMVTGITGSGKSTTTRKLLNAAMAKKSPILVIEPAKEEYVTWALRENKRLPEKDRIKIFMPGVREYDGQMLEQLRLNPFEPAAAENGKLNIMGRLERFKAALLASLPATDVLPLIIEEALYEHVCRTLGPDVLREELDTAAIKEYPLIEGLSATADKIIGTRGYEPGIRDNLKAAVRTRINSLVRGWKKDIFNCSNSTSYKELFEGNVVINLNRIADDRDKSLIMSLLLISLCEYRESKFRTDEAYRKYASEGMGKLCHLTVIEEAHRLLRNPGPDLNGVGNPQAVVSNMFCEMLSEIRAYGQGLLIVDQVPSRLIPDAIKNTNLKIVHRLVARDDRGAMSACMALRQEQEDIISALPTGEAIICSDHDDAAAWIRIWQ